MKTGSQTIADKPEGYYVVIDVYDARANANPVLQMKYVATNVDMETAKRLWKRYARLGFVVHWGYDMQGRFRK